VLATAAGVAMVAGVFNFASTVMSQSVPPARQITVDPDGTAHVKNATLAPSTILSAEGKAALARPTEGAPAPPAANMDELRKQMNARLQPNLQASLDRFPVEVQETTMGGISVAVVTPKGGLPDRNKNRVLINVPGGGWRTGIRANGLMVGIPVASVGGYKVVSILYRQGPEYLFPASNEDLTKVYDALQAQGYKPANIGMFGCSAGAQIIASTVGGYIRSGKPAPGVLGLYCMGAGAEADGDSSQFSGLWSPSGGTGGSGAGNAADLPTRSYFEGMKLTDPAISPVYDAKVIARFPPTIFISATRDFTMSRAAFSYRQLIKAGVDSDFVVYDGLGHGFMTNARLPETREAAEIASRFYDRHLAR
jgi:acetyl esterase/lipase